MQYHGGHNDYQPAFFFFRHPILVKTTRILQKTPEFQEMAIMIFLSELILAFFF